MFELQIFNPISLQMEAVLTMPEMADADAMVRAEEFLFSRGVKCGELVKNGIARGKSIFAFHDEESSASGSGGFRFSPLSPTYHVFTLLREVLDIEIASFVDLGCGPGNILMGAYWQLGATRLTGVEIDAGLAQRARDNTRSLNANIIEADLMEWHPAENDFDMVYMYEPIRDIEKREEFLFRMKGWLKHGQYVFYQHVIGELPSWLIPVDIKPFDHAFLFTFDGSRP